MALALLLLHQQQLARQHGARAVAVVLRCAGSSSGSDSSSCGLRQHQQLLQQTSRLHTSSSTDALQHAVPELGLFSAGAAALDALHSLSGLPWWAVIPAAAVGIKTLLLPLSLKQAKIVRTNMVLWSEAHEFQRQQETRRQRLRQEQQEQGATQQHQHQQQQQQQQQAPAHAAGQSSTEAAATTLQQLQQWQGRLQLYHSLRRKCGVPHPAWFLVNSSLQVRGCGGTAAAWGFP
jgi:membrane protein insertase Oxa1/YidC/SpoIIIJ